MSKAEDRKVALNILRRLFEEGQIEEVRFGVVPQLLIKGKGSRQSYLALGSSWMLIDALPDPLPNSEDDFPHLDIQEQIKVLSSIRAQTISDIEITNKHPHLILTLRRGQFLFLNGLHYGYECWQAGAWHNPGGSSRVVVCPGGKLAIWKK